MNALQPNPMHERDLSLETPRDENYARNSQPAAPTKSVKRTFSWGKRKKAAKAAGSSGPVALSEEATVVTIDPVPASFELGLELHSVTGDVFVSYVGPSISGVEPGDNVLAIDGMPLDGGDMDALVEARQMLRDSRQPVQLILQRHSVRREVLTRHASLRGTSLDKIGLTLSEENAYVVVTDVAGIAARSRRIAVGDRIVAINGTRVSGNLQGAVDLLAEVFNDDDSLEVALDLVYGFVPPANHDFDSESGTYLPRPEPASSVLSVVRRSLSFGKKKKGGSSSRRGSEVAEPLPEISSDERHLAIAKNDRGMILVTFKAHEVTSELIIGLVGEGSPAALAGVEVGDAVLSVQGLDIHCLGEDALEQARNVLAKTQHLPTVDLVVQTRVRTETLEFGSATPGAPRTHLGLNFYSFPGDLAVRVTGMSGPAAKSGRLAVGDRIVAVNGVRVNHAQTLSDHVSAAAASSDYVTFEVALGYSAGEGLWYGAGGAESKEGEAPRKAKRSFSFGRKPKH